MEDEKIVELFLLRDESAIEHTSEKYGRRLRALSYGIVTDLLTAEECENDTYAEAWNTIPPHEPKSYLYAYLARITRHISLNVCRKNSALKRSAYISELSTELEQCLPAPGSTERNMDDLILRGLLNDFLASLDDEKRNIFVRRYWYLDSVADISNRFALSESKVKTTLFRCRKKLKEQLEKEGYTI